MDVPEVRKFLIEIGRRNLDRDARAVHDDVALRAGEDWRSEFSQELAVLKVVAMQELSLLPHDYLGASRGFASRLVTMPQVRRFFEHPQSQYLGELWRDTKDAETLEKLLRLLVELGT